MNKIESCFLTLICSHVRNQPIENDLGDWSADEWENLFGLAANHSVLPMVFDRVYKNEDFIKLPEHIKELVKRQTVGYVMNQASHSTQFLKIYQKILNAGLNCLVVKGIICRQMYLKPDYRCSNDEDLYISKEQFAACHRIILEQGLSVVNESELENMENIHVVSYIDFESGLHIELHQTLFEEDSKSYGYLNDYFKDSFKDAVSIVIDDVTVRTLSYTDNMLYLVCHAFKHFVMRGFGIRQLCDIILFAENYGSQIDWGYMEKALERGGADVFFANLLDIGERYFCFSKEKACMSDSFIRQNIDSKDLLEDILDSGVFGKSSSSRLHSNSMTLDAVANRQEKNSGNRAVLGALFPNFSVMKKRYSVLNKMPWLLPIMWLHRIFAYIRENIKNKNGELAKDTLDIGRRRVELLRKYNIIK